jgi:hypothetical protein
MLILKIIAVAAFVVLCIFVGWLVWRAFLLLVHSGILETIGGMLATIVFGGCLFLIGLFVPALISDLFLGIYRSIFGG